MPPTQAVVRPICLVLLALFTTAIFAKKDDISCVVHSADCGKCVSDGCVWCSDGYCVSPESDVCDASRVSTTCDKKLPEKDGNHAHPRQTRDCESIIECDDCAAAADCNVCTDAETSLFKCSSTSTCVAPPYLLPYEQWIVQSGLKLEFASGGNCPTQLDPASNSPAINFTILLLLFVSNPTCADVNPAYAKATILKLIESIISPSQYNANGITLVGCTLTAAKKRQAVAGDLYEADLLVKFADMGGITAQGIGATVVSQSTTAMSFTVDEKNGSPITVTPYLPGTGTSGQVIVTSGHKKNNNASLSKGALAGIIIGCIIFGAVLVAIIAWLVLRSRESNPRAFRAAAAAYRP